MRCGIIIQGKDGESHIAHPTSVVQCLPFDLAQGGESFDFAQDREPVERLVEPFRASCFELETPFLGFNGPNRHI